MKIFFQSYKFTAVLVKLSRIVVVFFNFGFGLSAFPHQDSKDFKIYAENSYEEKYKKSPHIKEIELVERHLFAGQGL